MAGEIGDRRLVFALERPGATKRGHARSRLDDRLITGAGAVAGIAELLEEHAGHFLVQQQPDQVEQQADPRDRPAGATARTMAQPHIRDRADHRFQIVPQRLAHAFLRDAIHLQQRCKHAFVVRAEGLHHQRRGLEGGGRSAGRRDRHRAVAFGKAVNLAPGRQRPGVVDADVRWEEHQPLRHRQPEFVLDDK